MALTGFIITKIQVRNAMPAFDTTCHSIDKVVESTTKLNRTFLRASIGVGRRLLV